MRHHLILAIVLASVLAILLVAPLPRLAREFGPLGNLAHAPTFALFAVLGFHAIERWRRWRPLSAGLATWAGLVMFGGMAEIVQFYVGRRPSFDDLLADALGAAAGLALIAGHRADSRIWRVVLPSLAVILVLSVSFPSLVVLTDALEQRTQTPLLSSFEKPRELSRWYAWDCRMRRVRQKATDGRWALCVELKPGKYPGVGMIHPYPDWTGYEYLVFDLDLKGDTPLDMHLKVEDEPSTREWEDRFEMVLHLQPGPNRIRAAIPLIAAGPVSRQLDLSVIHFIQLFAVNLKEPRTFYLDNVRLE
ncbi:MAG: VanZ family protein [Pirellulales bacterium]|nr:VanZ family protein [Pirellulales bacterium]